MCHDKVKFQYWLSSEFRVRGNRNDAEYRLDFSMLPPGESWEVKLKQYALQCDDGAAVDTDGNDAPIGIIEIIGFSLPYNMEVNLDGNIKMSPKFSRIDLGPYAAGADECCVNPSSDQPAIVINRPLTGTYRVELMSGTSGHLVAGKAADGSLQPWVMLLEFTRRD